MNKEPMTIGARQSPVNDGVGIDEAQIFIVINAVAIDWWPLADGAYLHLSVSAGGRVG